MSLSSLPSLSFPVILGLELGMTNLGHGRKVEMRLGHFKSQISYRTISS